MKSGIEHINSFFLEMILVLFFFSVSVVITLQLFVSASGRANQSRDLSAAILCAQNVAEQVKGLSSAEEVPELLKTAIHTKSGDGTDHYRVDYDKDWNRTAQKAHFSIDVSLKKSLSASGTMIDADIQVRRYQSGGDTTLFTLNPAKYLPKTVQST